MEDNTMIELLFMTVYLVSLFMQAFYYALQ